MIQISSDVFGLVLLAQAMAAWLAFVFHLREKSRLRAELSAPVVHQLPARRLPDITEPTGEHPVVAQALPRTRTSMPTVPLADLPN